MSVRIFNTSINRALQFSYTGGGSLSLPEFRRLHIQEGLNHLAEEITLFGTVAVQVVGDNGALPMLVYHLGLRETERLLDQGVFEFVLNPTRLLISVQTHKVTPPLILGTWSAQNFNDPEASIETGLMRSSVGERLTEVERQRLVRKARDHYKLPNQRASNDAVAMTLQAYEQGVFTDFGLEPKDWGETTFDERELLSHLGEDLFLLGIVAEFQYGTDRDPCCHIVAIQFCETHKLFAGNNL